MFAVNGTLEMTDCIANVVLLLGVWWSTS